MKEYQMRELKKSWEDASQYRTYQKSLPRGLDFDPQNSGPASLQRFSGEDTDQYERKRLQKEQMRTWIQEQIAEKSYLNKIRRDDDMSYADMIKAIDEIRAATEREEFEMRKYIQDSVKMQNQDVSGAVCWLIMVRTHYFCTFAVSCGSKEPQ